MTQKPKYMLFVMICFLVGVFTLNKVDAIHSDLPLLGRVIFVALEH